MNFFALAFEHSDIYSFGLLVINRLKVENQKIEVEWPNEGKVELRTKLADRHFFKPDLDIFCCFDLSSCGTGRMKERSNYVRSNTKRSNNERSNNKRSNYGPKRLSELTDIFSNPIWLFFVAFDLLSLVLWKWPNEGKVEY